MTDDEFRALVAQGPAVTTVSKTDMLRLLDERDAAVRRAEAAVAEQARLVRGADKRLERADAAEAAVHDIAKRLTGEAVLPSRQAVGPAELGTHVVAHVSAQIERLEAERDAARADAARMREARRGIYVASRASIPERGAMWRRLRAEGHTIVSTWIDEGGEGQTADFGDLWERIRREVTGAQALILYAESGDFPLKGALIEVGIALAAGVPVLAVLPGVVLEPRSMRPAGSWLAHPLVRIVPTVDAALAAAGGEARGATS